MKIRTYQHGFLASQSYNGTGHPHWNDSVTQTSAGGFVDFRRTIDLDQDVSDTVLVQITADTRYRLYINSRFVVTGPVKGDQQEWFFDEIDIQPFLRTGRNEIAVRVLRSFYGSQHAVSFVRIPVPGLLLRLPHHKHAILKSVATSEDGWEASKNHDVRLPIDIKDDDFSMFMIMFGSLWTGRHRGSRSEFLQYLRRQAFWHTPVAFSGTRSGRCSACTTMV